jgi:hypothetical protein
MDGVFGADEFYLSICWEKTPTFGRQAINTYNKWTTFWYIQKE